MRGDKKRQRGHLMAGLMTALAILPIAGVWTLCEEKPFRVHNGLTEHAEWRFTCP